MAALKAVPVTPQSPTVPKASEQAPQAPLSPGAARLEAGLRAQKEQHYAMARAASAQRIQVVEASLAFSQAKERLAASPGVCLAEERLAAAKVQAANTSAEAAAAKSWVAEVAVIADAAEAKATVSTPAIPTTNRFDLGACLRGCVFSG